MYLHHVKFSVSSTWTLCLSLQKPSTILILYISKEAWATDLHNPECSMHVRVCVYTGMSIDSFSAFPNLIIHTGLGTGPTQWARERSWSQMKMELTKTSGSAGKTRVEETLRIHWVLQNWVTVFYCSNCFWESDKIMSKTYWPIQQENHSCNCNFAIPYKFVKIERPLINCLHLINCTCNRKHVDTKKLYLM